MAENKKGFVLYADQKSLIDKLPDETAGKLIKHIFAYINDENPKTDDLLVEIAFEPIKQHLKRDLIKYDEIKERRSEAGKKGMKSRWGKQNITKHNKAIKPITKITVKDKGNVKDKEINIKTPLENSIDDFVEMRKKIRKPITDKGIELLLKNLEKLSGGDESKKILIIEQSIMNSWQGVFELKTQIKAAERHMIVT